MINSEELFYTSADPAEFFELNQEESKHITRVLRLGAGDEILLTNGRGTLYHAKIESTNSGICLLKITERKEAIGKRQYHLHIGIAPTKNMERLEWFLEKATEIGIDEITPVVCRRSERKEIKTDRLMRVMISAMKQSMQTFLPVLNPIASFNDVIRQMNNSIKIICSMDAVRPLSELCHRSESIFLLIGPEGDFHPDEIQSALQEGFAQASLGKMRLRTETAGVVACTSIALINS
jgi:16S rRNA (uracil1498-N3)-methyltransferase